MRFTPTSEELRVILERHKLFLKEEDLGIKANLCGADLHEANLCGADLRGADLLHAAKKIYQSSQWTAFIDDQTIEIGCQKHSVKAWQEFSDNEIMAMHELALEYWKENKDIVMAISKSIQRGQ